MFAHDIAVIPSDGGDPDSRGQLFVTDTQGDQAYRFQLTDGINALAVTPDFHPMRLFAGRGLVATSLGIWSTPAIDGSPSWRNTGRDTPNGPSS